MRWSPPVELSPREARICKRHEKNRRFYRFARLHRHELFDNAMQDKLAALYADKPRGMPPHPPARLAMALLLQAYAKISDAAVIEEIEHDARWQMVLDCMGADEAPFSETTLVDFRARLVKAGFAAELLRKTVALAKASKDFGYKQAAGLRVALDSAPLEGAGKVEDTFNLLGHALRLLVMVVAAYLGLDRVRIAREAGLTLLLAPSIKAALDLDWEARGARDVALRAVAAQLEAFEAWWGARAPRDHQTPAIDAAQAQLALVAAQNTERAPDGQLRMREGVAPDRLISLSDPEMRHGRKHQTQRIDGYKKYLATDVDNALVLAAGVLPANLPEARGAEKLAPELRCAAPGACIAALYIDRAFVASGLASSVDAAGGRVVCRPLPAQGVEGLFSKRAFTIDLAAATVTCPAGRRVPIEAHRARFATAVCSACPQRARCQKPTTRPGRVVKISPQEALLQKLVVAANVPEGRAALRERTCVEHALAHHCRRQGPRARYRGVAKNDFDAVRIAAVQNLLEIDRRERGATRARVKQAA